MLHKLKKENRQSIPMLETDHVRLGNDASEKRIGYSLVIFMFFVVGGWATFAPIDSAALAPGVVQVEGKRKKVQHLEGGRVAEILVESGDTVDAGDPLIRLDATSDKAQLKILTGQIFNARARVERLQAERDDLAFLSFSHSLTEASLNDPRAKTAISNEESLFIVRKSDRDAKVSVLNSRIKGFRGMVRSNRIVSDSLAIEISDLEDLLKEGYVDKQRLRELERSRTKVLGDIADLEVSVEEAQLQILQLQKSFKTDVVDELARTSEELYGLNQQFSAVEDKVRRSTIVSPISGVTLNLKPNTIGAVISPGEKLMEIVPQINELIVEVRISPMDIDRIIVGQSAEVRFSVFKDAYMITGMLTKLAADRLIDESTGLPYFLGEVQLLEDDLALLDGMALVPGMPAEVLIKTGERTMLRYLISPMARMTSRSLIED